MLLRELLPVHSLDAQESSGAIIEQQYFCVCWPLSHHTAADFLTGVYHWSVDNYGDRSTPVVGSQIADFQRHHQKPWESQSGNSAIMSTR